MKILYLDSVDSTQTYLKNLIKKESVKVPYAVLSNIQTNGVGSRNNSWTGLEGNLFLSFAIERDDLPDDLKLESASIYFAYLLKDILNKLGSKIWLKWPNDFYIDNLKIGGMITSLQNSSLICGVGLNLVHAPENFAKLDIDISKIELLNLYIQKIEEKLSWKQVFSKYKLEFQKNKEFSTHHKNFKISLKDASLQNDGSIVNNGERIYSLR